MASSITIPPAHELACPLDKARLLLVSDSVEQLCRLRASLNCSCLARYASSDSGRRTFSADSLPCASATRCFAPSERAAHICNAWVSCDRCSRQVASCALR